jgi:hypothetical protein
LAAWRSMARGPHPVPPSRAGSKPAFAPVAPDRPPASPAPRPRPASVGTGTARPAPGIPVARSTPWSSRTGQGTVLCLRPSPCMPTSGTTGTTPQWQRGLQSSMWSGVASGAGDGRVQGVTGSRGWLQPLGGRARPSRSAERGDRGVPGAGPRGRFQPGSGGRHPPVSGERTAGQVLLQGAGAGGAAGGRGRRARIHDHRGCSRRVLERRVCRSGRCRWRAK